MNTQGCKAKGRSLQNWVRDKILDLWHDLTEADVKSTPMGHTGEDIQMSENAKNSVMISIECKSRKQHAVYTPYKQAKRNCEGREPVLIIKQNHSQPLAVVDADYFLTLQYIVANVGRINAENNE